MARHGLTVEVGRVPIRLETASEPYADVLAQRFDGFLTDATPQLEFEIELVDPVEPDPDDDLLVSRRGDAWTIRRSDCEAEFDVRSGRGRIRQPAHPYATDTVMRVVHSLLLAPAGGILVHASSAISGGRAFVFFGRSGAGKSTMVGMAPNDVTVLSEEISYVRREGDAYWACGTPFTGELNRRGDNVEAPLAGMLHLVQGADDRIEPLGPGDALRALLRCVLYFDGDPAGTQQAFAAACGVVDRVPMGQLVFRRHPDVWKLFA
jgi:hypothetical protein